MEAFLKEYGLLLLPIYFVALWTVILFLLAWLGGWRRLHQHFPARGEPRGETLRFQTMRIGISNYKRVLTLILSNEGFYIASWGPFRLAHPPLLIPWREIRTGEPHKFLWMEVVDVTVGSTSPVKMKMEKKVAERFAPFLQKS